MEAPASNDSFPKPTEPTAAEGGGDPVEPTAQPAAPEADASTGHPAVQSHVAGAAPAMDFGTNPEEASSAAVADPAPVFDSASAPAPAPVSAGVDDAAGEASLEQTFTAQAAAAQPGAADARPELSVDDELAEALAGVDADALMNESAGGEENPANRAAPKPGGRAVRGQVRRGTVTALRGEDVFVDLAGEEGSSNKLQGIVPAQQFEHPPRIGALMDFVVDHADEAEGLVFLSREGAISRGTWDEMEVGSAVEARVTGSNKGGLELELAGSIKAFMPASQVDVGSVEDLSIFHGQKIEAEVTEIDRRHKKVLLSRRKLQDRQRAVGREKLLKELEVGQTREGVITNLMAFGAFVDLGGVEGLLHVSDLAHNRIDKPGDVLSVGQKVTVKVLKLENLHGEEGNTPKPEELGGATERGGAGGGVTAPQQAKGGKKKRNRPRIALGIKQITPDPWDGLADRYTVGEDISVRVVKTTTFGAFAEIEPGVEGLLPISELAWNRTEKVEDVVKKGDAIKVQILKIEPNKKRFTLSLKAAAGDPWATGDSADGSAGAGLGVAAGDQVKGRVTTVTDFGAFVALESGVEGLVHISELADRRVDKVTDILNVGDEKTFKVKSVEPEKRKIALSLRTKPSPREAREAEEAQLLENRPKAKPRIDKRNLKSGLGGGGGMGQGLGGLSLSDFTK